MNYYLAYNLCIASEILLPELPLAENNNYDVIVRLRSINEYVHQNDFVHTKRISGCLEGLAKVVIEDGKTITLEPLAGIDESRLSASIVNGCMAVILRQRGYLVLHASSVVIDSNIVAFVGNSGAGKSTLAAFFAEQGHQVLTDDVMAIRFREEGCVVLPSYPQIKLRPNSVKALKCECDRHKNAPFRKFSYHVDQVEASNTLILSHIYVLAIGECNRIDQLDTNQGFAELVRNTRAMSLFNDYLSASTHLAHCTKLIEKVQIRKFFRRPDLNGLSELIKIIKLDCDSR